jgi:hypothetical protein
MFFETRKQLRSRAPEIRGRLVDFKTARDIHEHVVTL